MSVHNDFRTIPIPIKKPWYNYKVGTEIRSVLIELYTTEATTVVTRYSLILPLAIPRKHGVLIPFTYTYM